MQKGKNETPKKGSARKANKKSPDADFVRMNLVKEILYDVDLTMRNFEYSILECGVRMIYNQLLAS